MAVVFCCGPRELETRMAGTWNQETAVVLWDERGTCSAGQGVPLGLILVKVDIQHARLLLADS